MAAAKITGPVNANFVMACIMTIAAPHSATVALMAATIAFGNQDHAANVEREQLRRPEHVCRTDKTPLADSGDPLGRPSRGISIVMGQHRNHITGKGEGLLLNNFADAAGRSVGRQV